MAKSRELTPMQTAFLDALFGEARGNIKEAKKLAGYSPNISEKSLVESLQDEIIAVARLQLAHAAPRAAIAMSDMLDDPVSLGAKEKMRAAEQILDRVGVSKTEKIELDGSAFHVVVLPPKD